MPEFSRKNLREIYVCAAAAQHLLKSEEIELITFAETAVELLQRIEELSSFFTELEEEPAPS